jgi:hypothetical protein
LRDGRLEDVDGARVLGGGEEQPCIACPVAETGERVSLPAPPLLCAVERYVYAYARQVGKRIDFRFRETNGRFPSGLPGIVSSAFCASTPRTGCKISPLTTLLMLVS